MFDTLIHQHYIILKSVIQHERKGRCQMNRYSQLQMQYMLKQITEEEYQKEMAAYIKSLSKYMALYANGHISEDDLISVINE